MVNIIFDIHLYELSVTIGFVLMTIILPFTFPAMSILLGHVNIGISFYLMEIPNDADVLCT